MVHAMFDSRTIHPSCVTLMGDILYDASTYGRGGENAWAALVAYERGPRRPIWPPLRGEIR